MFYDRADDEGPKLSNFECCELPLGTNLLSVLSQAINLKGVLKKSRTLCMIGQTRVHIDRVEGLGDFMELEVRSYSSYCLFMMVAMKLLVYDCILRCNCRRNKVLKKVIL